jgi:hypothetical protein
MRAHLLACEALLHLDAPEEAMPDLAAALGRSRAATAKRSKRRDNTA